MKSLKGMHRLALKTTVRERLNFLLCCRCCQALLRIFFCILWALYYLAPSGLTASLGVGTSWSNDLLIVRV
jgi:hypothetical protein